MNDITSKASKLTKTSLRLYTPMGKLTLLITASDSSPGYFTRVHKLSRLQSVQASRKLSLKVLFVNLTYADKKI
jgi:hypothetical protein